MQILLFTIMVRRSAAGAGFGLALVRQALAVGTQ